MKKGKQEEIQYDFGRNQETKKICEVSLSFIQEVLDEPTCGSADKVLM